jgi:hypothetical protein
MSTALSSCLIVLSRAAKNAHQKKPTKPASNLIIETRIGLVVRVRNIIKIPRGGIIIAERFFYEKLTFLVAERFFYEKLTFLVAERFFYEKLKCFIYNEIFQS